MKQRSNFGVRCGQVEQITVRRKYRILVMQCLSVRCHASWLMRRTAFQVVDPRAAGTNNQGLAYRYVIVARCIEVAKTQSASRMGYSEPKRHIG
jgi:hypothetical protein